MHVLLLAAFAAADTAVFTQKAEILPVQVRGQTAGSTAPTPPTAEPAPTGGPVPLWIWGADTNARYVLSVEFPGGTKAARLMASCDNVMSVSINGKKVAASSEWQQPVDVDVQQHILPGKNVLTAEVANQGGAAGFIARLILTMPDGATRFVVSDETWMAAPVGGKQPNAPVKKVARLGGTPWGNVFDRRGGPATVVSGNFEVPAGFQVERLFTVPKETLGSWVCITFDDKGRLIASDQGNQGLCRVTMPKPGTDELVKVERLKVKMSSAQGLLHAFGCLYVSANGGPGSGLYRLRDTTGDDQYDEVTKLKEFRGGGEHGPHALRLSPDGKSILVACGNHTRPPEPFQYSRVPRNWDEDHLLPRQWDANGHARGILAPGGWIARTDPEGKTWEIVSIGYRNQYDFAFNADGEMFVYDADMEWDMGMPWYRPTRVNHATSGSELGWRSGTGKWPPYYVDSLPAMLDIGPGSPVGVEFGYGTKFPARYQKALFILDWTFGTIYSIHIEPDGATYKATKEEFLSRTPLPLTDVAVGPDGALYFAIGGRGTQSELFRVRYVGSEPTTPVEYKNEQGAKFRALRQKIEAFHVPSADPAAAVAVVYPHLKHQDRFIRYAARVALEHQPPKVWQDRVLAETDPDMLIQGAVALARQGDKSLEPKLLEALGKLEFSRLTERQQLDLLRAYSLVFIRMGEPEKDTAAVIAKTLDAYFPAKSDALNRELVQVLVYLKSPTIITKTLALMKQPSKPPSAEDMAELLARNKGYGGTIAKILANAPDLQKLHYAFVLRNAREGWTPEQRQEWFAFLNDARSKSGGASYQGFINNMEKDAFDNASDLERLAIEAAGLRKPFKPKELPAPKGPGRAWTLDDLTGLQDKLAKGRDYKAGMRAYAASRCVVCHRFNGEGGATGPDLSQVAGRFNLKDLAEAIVDPSKVVSDQYKASIVVTGSGKVFTGKIVSESKDKLIILTDPEDSTKVVEVKKDDVEEVRPSPTSLMPKDLLNPLNETEVLDLLAYLLSRGDPGHPMFRK